MIDLRVFLKALCLLLRASVDKSLIVSFCIFSYILLPSSAFAHTLAEIQSIIESEIEKSRQNEVVVLHFKKQNIMPNSDKFELLSLAIQNNRSIQATLELAGKQYELTGTFEVAKYISVPAKDLKPGHVIEASDLANMKVSDARYKHNYAISNDMLVGHVAKRTLFANKAIKLNDIKKIALIVQGERVSLLYRHNNLSIEATGIALEDAALGESIKVKNDDTNKTLSGKVLNNKTVLVE